MEPVFLRTEFNYDVMAASDASALVIPEGEFESMTDQSQVKECDINTILERFGITGQLPQDVRQPMQGDFTNVHSFQEALDAVIAARESFVAQPAEVRARFGNDPAAFYNYCVARDGDGNLVNKEEMLKMGLSEKPLPPAARLEDVITAIRTPVEKT